MPGDLRGPGLGVGQRAGPVDHAGLQGGVEVEPLSGDQHAAGPAVPDLFSGVRWSTHYALADTLRRCEFENRRVTFLPVLEDLDTPDALERLRAALADDPHRAPATARVLAPRA